MSDTMGLNYQYQVSPSQRSHEDLNVFIPDDIDEQSLNHSIESLKAFLSVRQRSDQSHWLIDISSWTSLDTFMLEFQDLNLDLDDDIFLFQENVLEINLWEVYRVHKELPLTINDLGLWNRDYLGPDGDSKWIRRHDLHGSIIRAMSIVTTPYVSALVPSGREDGTLNYTDGIVPDIVAYLQVLKYLPSKQRIILHTFAAGSHELYVGAEETSD